MDRFYLKSHEWGNRLQITGDEAHHCSRVMRKRIGDRVLVFDGSGREMEAVITSISKERVELGAGMVRETEKVSPEIEIAVGIPKGKSFDLILQKAVEMGVDRIQPLMSAQGNVRFSSSERTAKRQKWDRLVLEACKQCGQNFRPEVKLPMEVGEYLERRQNSDGQFVGALLPDAKPFRDLLSGVSSFESVTLMIGPEGDFSPSEYENILRAGFAPVDLGRLVLRTETAVFSMIASVRYQFQT